MRSRNYSEVLEVVGSGNVSRRGSTGVVTNSREKILSPDRAMDGIAPRALKPRDSEGVSTTTQAGNGTRSLAAPILNAKVISALRCGFGPIETLVKKSD